MSESQSSSDDQVTLWISRLRADQNSEAAQRLWNRYSTRLAAVAKQRLGELGRRVYDEEDAAISAFRSFCSGIARDQFLDLNDRDNIWRLLVTITARKVTARQRYERRARRGGDDNWEEPLFQDSDGRGLDRVAAIVDPEPTPEFAAEVAEECEALLERLEDNTLRTIALLKLEGYSNDEIAERLQCTRRSVQRKLARIRVKLGEDTEEISD